MFFNTRTSGLICIAALACGVSLSNLVYGQTASKINCLQPQAIAVSSKLFEAGSNEQLYFKDHDLHTFWYKLSIRETGKLSFSVDAENGDGHYNVTLYAHNGINFCKNFVKGDLDLYAFEENLPVKVRENDIYYLGVYPLEAGDCGHTIQLTFNETVKTITASSLDTRCKEKNINEIKVDFEEIVEYNGANATRVHGFIKNARTLQPITAQLAFFNPFKQDEYNTFSSGDKGFSLNLERGEDYQVDVSAIGFKTKSVIISGYDDEVYEVLMEEMKLGEKLVLEHIHFYPNTYALREESQGELDRLLAYMKENAEVKIEIQGHTNGSRDIKKANNHMRTGSAWNFQGTAKELSLQRANTIADYLKKNGIEKYRLETTGKGGLDMLVPYPKNMSDVMKNIRVEVHILAG